MWVDRLKLWIDTSLLPFTYFYDSGYAWLHRRCWFFFLLVYFLDFMNPKSCKWLNWGNWKRNSLTGVYWSTAVRQLCYWTMCMLLLGCNLHVKLCLRICLPLPSFGWWITISICRFFLNLSVVNNYLFEIESDSITDNICSHFFTTCSCPFKPSFWPFWSDRNLTCCYPLLSLPWGSIASHVSFFSQNL